MAQIKGKVTQYRLSREAVHDYLRELFKAENPKKFEYKFNVRGKIDHWVFDLPRKLTTAEKEGLESKREQDDDV